MSLYLGKDNKNKNILHLTNGVNSENSMKSGKQPNTFFLTSEANFYFTVDRFPITPRTSSYSYSLQGTAGGNTLGWFPLVVSYPYTGSVSNKYTFTSNLSTSDSLTISNSKLSGDVVFFIDSYGKVISEVSVTNTVFSPAGTNPSTGNPYNYVYTSTNNTLGFCVTASGVSEAISLLNRVKEVVVLKTKYREALEGPIKVTNKDITIGGTSIFKDMNIGVFTTSPISTLPSSLNQILPGLIVSDSSKVDSIKLSSNHTDSFIEVDGVKVFSKDTIYSNIGGSPIHTISSIQVSYNTFRSNQSILNLGSIVGASKHVVVKAKARFIVSKNQAFGEYFSLAYLILMDTPSNLIIADVGWDSEGPGGGCRGSTYVYLRYSGGHITISNPKVDYRCYSTYPWYQMFYLDDVEIYTLD